MEDGGGTIKAGTDGLTACEEGNGEEHSFKEMPARTGGIDLRRAGKKKSRVRLD